MTLTTENRLIWWGTMALVITVGMLVGLSGWLVLTGYVLGLMVAVLLQVSAALVAENDALERARERRAEASDLLAESQRRVEEMVKQYGSPTLPPRR